MSVEEAGSNGIARAGSSVAGASTMLAILAGMAKVMGFLRDRSLAIAFGAGPASDAYLVAAWLPPVAAAWIVNAVNTSLLPVFTELRVKGDDGAAWRLVSVVLSLAVAFSGAMAAAGALCAGGIVAVVAPGFGGGAAATTADLLRIMMPTMVFLSLFSVLSAVLYSFRCFAPPAWGALVINGATIAGIVIGARRFGIAAVAAGTAAGYILQAALLVPFLRGRSARIYPCFDVRDPNVRRVLLLGAPVAVVAVLSQASGVIEKSLASGLSPGSIAALTFANKLIMLPAGLFATAVSTVVFPVMAEAASRGDLRSVSASVQRGIRMLTYITLPAVVGLVVLRRPIVRALFERGAFGPEATEATAIAVLCYSASMLFKSVDPVLSRAFHAMQDTVAPSAIAVASVPLFGIVAVLLAGPLGHAGIALATSVSSAAAVAMSVAVLRRRHRVSLGLRPLALFVARLAVPCAMLAGAAGLALSGAERLGLGRITSMIGAVGLGAAVYFTSTLAAGIDEARDAVRLGLSVFMRVFARMGSRR